MPIFNSFSALSHALADASLAPALRRNPQGWAGLLNMVGESARPLTVQQKRTLTELLNNDPDEWLSAFLKNPKNAEAPFYFSNNPLVQKVADFAYGAVPIERNPFALHYTRNNYAGLHPEEYLDLYHGTHLKQTNEPYYTFLDPTRNEFNAGVFQEVNKVPVENWAMLGGNPGRIYNTIAKIERPLIFEPAPETWGYAWNDFKNARLSPSSHPEAYKEFVEKTGYNPNWENPWLLAKERILSSQPDAGYLSTDAISGSPLLSSRDATVYRGIRDISENNSTVVTTNYPNQTKIKSIKTVQPGPSRAHILYPEYTPTSPQGENLQKAIFDAQKQYEFAEKQYPGLAEAQKELDLAHKKANDFTPPVWDSAAWTKASSLNDEVAKAKAKYDHIFFSKGMKEYLEPYADAINKAKDAFVDAEQRMFSSDTGYKPEGLHTFDESHQYNMFRSALAAPAAGIAAKAMSPAEAQAAILKDEQDSLQGMSPSWYLDPIELGSTFLAGAPLRTLDLAGRALNTAGTFLFDTILGAIPKADIQAAPEEYYTAAQ